jgi:hypothetical protein
VAYTLEDQNRDAARLVHRDALRIALREAIGLLRDLRDCPLADLERRQEEIDEVITAGELVLSAP